SRSRPLNSQPPRPMRHLMATEPIFERILRLAVGSPSVRSARALAPLLVCASLSIPVLAQGLSLGGVSQDRPIEISADSGIEWQQNAQVYIARGSAVAKRGTTEVHADTLTAHYRPSKGGGGENEIYRLEPDGHDKMKSATQTVGGAQAVYDVDQQIGIVTGKALKLTTPTDVVTARDSFEWYDQKQVAVARGDAVAMREAKQIRADVLTAHMTKDKPKTDENKPAAKPAKPTPAAATAH